MRSASPASIDLADGNDTADLGGDMLVGLPNQAVIASWAVHRAAAATEYDRAAMEAIETDPLILSSAAGSLW